jgi:small-conductance mechanosensitive channel
MTVWEYWAPELVALLLTVPVYAACRIELIEKGWATLSRLRLHQLGEVERLCFPANLGGIVGVSVILGTLSLLGNAYPHMESRWISVAGLAIYTYASYRMISVNHVLVKNTAAFIQKCRRVDRESLRNHDLEELLDTQLRNTLEGIGVATGKSTAWPLWPRRSFASIFLEEKESQAALAGKLTDGVATLRSVSIYRIFFLTTCVAMPTFWYLSNLGFLDQHNNLATTEKLITAVDTTLQMVLHGTTDLVDGAEKIPQGPFFVIARFGFFFLLTFAPLRYASLLLQYQALGWSTRESGLGLEVDAMSKLSSFFVILAAALVSLLILEVDFSSLGLLTGLVAAGMSIAMRDTLGNLMAGMQLIWDRSLKRGDVITIPTPESRDTGSTYGIVEEIRMRYTVVQDRNTVRRLIPNHLLTANPIEHWTHEDNKVRLSLRISVSYEAGDRLREIQKIMESVCYDVQRVLTDKPPVALLVEYGDSAIIFSLRFWLEDAKVGIRPVISDVLINLYERFEEAKIKIPFPQRDIHIRSLPASDLKSSSTESSSTGSQNPIGGSPIKAMIEGPGGRTVPA